jgi:xanthine dehydrogenase YagR molybdenum-binding subunit
LGHTADTPEFDIDFINEPDPHMPDLGARGIGEIGIVGAPAARARSADHTGQVDLVNNVAR